MKINDDIQIYNIKIIDCRKGLDSISNEYITSHKILLTILVIVVLADFTFQKLKNDEILLSILMCKMIS